MSIIRQRSVKGSPLTQSEVDENFRTKVSQKISSYIITNSDNRDTIEFSGSSLSCNLPSASSISNTATGSETASFEVTIKNLDPTNLTIIPDGLDVINKSNVNFILKENDSIRLQVNSTGTGWNTLSQSKEGLNIVAYGKLNTGSSPNLSLSQNVTVTYIAVGTYRIDFINPLPSVPYQILLGTEYQYASGPMIASADTGITTNSFVLFSFDLLTSQLSDRAGSINFQVLQ